MDQIISLIINIFGLVAMGVYITYKILDFPDLSVDGTYPLGASIVAALLIKGVNPWVATLCAFLGGAVAGFVTAFLHVKFNVWSFSYDGVIFCKPYYYGEIKYSIIYNTSYF